MATNNRIVQQSPTLEKIQPSVGQSFTMKQFQSGENNAEAFWHFHPELEIAYISNGNGKRHVGNHLSYYQGGDLIFIGPNLPHYGFTDRFTGSGSEIIIQMKAEFLGENFFDLPEMTSVKNLFKRSVAGISFYGNTKTQVGERLQNMFHMSTFERVIEFLKVLQILSTSKEYQMLNVEKVNLMVNKQDSDRINKIYKYVRKNFNMEEIPLQQMADLVNMTVPSFCRYFKKHTNKTFTQFVNEYRIVHATKLLHETDLPISEICFESGFNNFSHFNRHFKKVTDKSPSEYRKELDTSEIIE